jgi:hypothetical protein
VSTLTLVLILALPAAAVAAAIVARPECRLAWFVFGGLLILSTRNVGWPKLIYMFGCLFVCAIAVLRADGRSRSHRLLLGAAAIVASLGAISFAVAFVRAVPMAQWFREVVPLYLMALAPVVAIDASKSSARILVIAEFVAAGLLAGAAYAIQRNSRLVPTQVLWTLMMPAALFAYACAASMSGSGRRMLWGVIAAVVLVEMLLSAERSVWGVLAIPAIMLMMRPRPALAELGSLAALGCVVALGFVLVLPSFAASIGMRQSQVERRLFSVWAAVTNPASDRSTMLHFAQTTQLFEAFARHPVLGTGPGEVFPSVGRGYLVMSTAVNDSPMEFPAKYGSIGVLLLLAAVLQVIAFGRESARTYGSTPALRALAAYGIFAIIVSLAHSPIVDKGFAFGLAFLLALSLIERGAHTDEPLMEPR